MPFKKLEIKNLYGFYLLEIFFMKIGPYKHFFKEKRFINVNPVSRWNL